MFHLDDIQKWLKTRSNCPLCQKEWEFTVRSGIRGLCPVGCGSPKEAPPHPAVAPPQKIEKIQAGAGAME